MSNDKKRPLMPGEALPLPAWESETPDPNDPSVRTERPVYLPKPKRDGWLHSPSACQVGGCEECKNVSDK